MTITTHIDHAGKYPVAQTPCPRFTGENVRLDVPRAGILHTTEGGWDGSMGVFRRHFAPHFIVGLDSHKKPAIAQLVPVGTIGAAIVTHNNLAIVQVEMVGFAQDKPWLPDPETLDALSSLMLTCRDVWGIALAHPWADGDFGKASDNPHRHSGKLGTFNGWLGHGDCPLPDCVSPDTPILCDDLSWRSAGDLREGDGLVGFDEAGTPAAGLNDNRRLVRSIVERNFIAKKLCALIHTDHGSVVASTDHPWLGRVPYLRHNQKRDKACGKRWRWDWLKTSDLMAGSEIAFLDRPWSAHANHDAGWLSGFFDGEGCLSMKADKTFAVTASQVLGPTADKLTRLLHQFGYDIHQAHRPFKEGIKPSMHVIIQGGRIAAMRFLGEIRPERLLHKAGALWQNALVPRSVRKAIVEAVEPLGVREVASLSTTSRTYIANGLLCHNTHWDPGALEWSKVFAHAKSLDKPSTIPVS